MENRILNTVQKQIRAQVIKEYLKAAGKNECVCFTCGNASKYLQDIGVKVTAVISPKKWYTFNEIADNYKMFDATSGHLPVPLMVEIAKRLKELLKEEPAGEIACGSGETYVTLKMAFPNAKLYPVYNLDSSTQYNTNSPLNWLVELIN